MASHGIWQNAKFPGVENVPDSCFDEDTISRAAVSACYLFFGRHENPAHIPREEVVILPEKAVKEASRYFVENDHAS